MSRWKSKTNPQRSFNVDEMGNQEFFLPLPQLNSNRFRGFHVMIDNDELPEHLRHLTDTFRTFIARAVHTNGDGTVNVMVQPTENLQPRVRVLPVSLEQFGTGLRVFHEATGLKVDPLFSRLPLVSSAA